MKNILSEKLIAHGTYKVSFFDLDPMNIMWHGHYAKLLEIGRSALLDLCGYNVNEMIESGFSFPIVDMRIKYIQPLIFDQLVIITTALKEYENRMKVVYEIKDQKSGKILSKAETTQVAVQFGSDSLKFVMPEIWIKKIEDIIG